MEIKTEKSFLLRKKFPNQELLVKCIIAIKDKLEERPKIWVFGNINFDNK